jgi:excisionase family DNA binding protein
MDTTLQLGLEPLIGVEELAGYLGVPVQTIYDWRLTGRAPRAFKLGKHLRFAVSDVQAWLDAQREDEHSEGGRRG